MSGSVVFHAQKRGVLEGIVQRVAAEPYGSGNGHNIILWAACRFAEEGQTLAQTQVALRAAVRKWQHPDPNANQTIVSGWRKVRDEGRLGKGAQDDGDQFPTFHKVCICPANNPESPDCVCNKAAPDQDQTWLRAAQAKIDAPTFTDRFVTAVRAANDDGRTVGLAIKAAIAEADSLEQNDVVAGDPPEIVVQGGDPPEGCLPGPNTLLGELSAMAAIPSRPVTSSDVPAVAEGTSPASEVHRRAADDAVTSSASAAVTTPDVHEELGTVTGTGDSKFGWASAGVGMTLIVPAVHLALLDRSTPEPLLLDRLDPTESTILYGPGGIGKGALASSWISQLVADGRRVLILDYENHGGEWARRIAGLSGDDALELVSWVAPMTEGQGAIWQHATEIGQWCRVLGANYVVIDSAVMACGGKDPSDPESPNKFNAALQQIGLPTLTLAHVTKLHDARYPFGSVFWHNLARVTWSMMPKGEEILLACRKANNYRRPSAQTVSMTWYEDALREVRERPAAWSLEDRIAEALADGPNTPTRITEILNDGLEPGEKVSLSAVKNALSRNLRKDPTSSRFTAADAKGAWRLRHPAEDVKAGE